jgi:putative ABC transport system permease protein
MIYDQTAARRSHLKLGDKLDLLGKKFKIVGLSGGTSSWMTGTSFITFDADAALRRASGTAGFILVSVKRRSQIRTVKNEIARKLPNLSVVPKEVMAANDVKLFAGVFNGPLRFMVVIAFLVGLMLVGLTIYTATVERAREYGVLKAIGIKNWRLYLVVFEQALISAAVGSIVGVGFSFIVVGILALSAPQFLILIEPSYILQVLPLAILISIFASYVPVRTISKIDPAIAFKKGALS